MRCTRWKRVSLNRHHQSSARCSSRPSDRPLQHTLPSHTCNAFLCYYQMPHNTNLSFVYSYSYACTYIIAPWNVCVKVWLRFGMLVCNLYTEIIQLNMRFVCNFSGPVKNERQHMTMIFGIHFNRVQMLFMWSCFVWQNMCIANAFCGKSENMHIKYMYINQENQIF